MLVFLNGIVTDPFSPRYVSRRWRTQVEQPMLFHV
jgi:hypothetical protein